LHLNLSEIDELLKLKFSFKQNLSHASLSVNNNANQDYDEKYVNNLRDDELDKLIRILILYEKHEFQGSVTAVPNLLKILYQRNSNNFEELFNWVISHNKNEYIPMGNLKGQNIKTFEEYARNIRSYCP
jgi:hypothetical protein